jgi:hypothetical protein
MAIDLLQPASTKHLYRHDLESLFYVIVIFVTRYHGGEKIKNPPLQTWFELPPKSLLHAKLTFLNELPLLPTSAFEILKSFLEDLGEMFDVGYMAQKIHKSEAVRSARRLARVKKDPKTTSVDQATLAPEFDDETLGGNVDFDKFQTLLNTIT